MKLLAIFFLLVTPSLTLAQSSTDGAIFEPVLPLLRQKTRVPLRLPTYLATESETYQLHAIVEAVSATRYELQLAFTPDCAGGNACRYGMVAGQSVGRSARRPRGKRVKLAHGVRGYFVDATCGANCSDSILSWQQGGYHYSVGIKAANVETLAKVANSAIKNWGRG